MPDAEFFKWLTTLGVGGVLAGMMFFFYRKDVKTYTDLWKAQTEVLMKTVTENTASNITLALMVKSLHEHMVIAGKIEDRREAAAELKR